MVDAQQRIVFTTCELEEQFFSFFIIVSLVTVTSVEMMM